LTTLGAVDADLGHAVVKLAERRAKSVATTARPAEIAGFGNHAVIVVTPVKALQRLSGVQLVPIGNGRCLVALEPSYSIPQLELDIRDALSRESLLPSERQTLETFAEILRTARGSRDAKAQARTIIVLEYRRVPRTR
jgi:hypothetical protein